MSENIQNWLSYGEKQVTTKDIRDNCLLFLVFALLYNAFRFQRFTITVADVLILALTIYLGIKARNKIAVKETFLFNGFHGMCLVYRFYAMSWLCATMSGADPIHTALLCAAIFLLLTFLLCKYLNRKIAQNGFSAEYRATSKVGPLIGAMLGTSLSPLLFRSVSQNDAALIAAILGLFLAAGFQFSINYVLKYLTCLKYEKM